MFKGKSKEKWIFLTIGVVGAYLLHGQISDIVNKIKGSVSSSRSSFNAYHSTPRLKGWQRPGFPGQGHAYGHDLTFRGLGH